MGIEEEINHTVHNGKIVGSHQIEDDKGIKDYLVIAGKSNISNNKNLPDLNESTKQKESCIINKIKDYYKKIAFWVNDLINPNPLYKNIPSKDYKGRKSGLK